MCYDEGRLMAYLDHEVTAEERAKIASHVAECGECAVVLERLATDSALAAAALGTLQPTAEVVPLPTPLEGRRVSARASAGGIRWTQVAAVAAVALVLSSFGLRPVRTAAANLLQVFRMQKVQTVTLSEADLQSIGTALKAGGHVDLKSFGEAWIVGGSSAATTVTLSQAQATVGFPVKLPSNAPAEPVIMLQQGRTYKFKLHVAAINEALTSYGSERTLPSALDNKEFSINVPPIVIARYPVPAGTNTAGWPSKSRGLYVGQARSPEIVVPDGVDAAQLRDVLLNLPFIPASVRNQIAAVQNWQSTLIIPNVDGTAHDVTIDGVPAVVITPKSAARDTRAKFGPLPDSTSVIWNDNGVIRAIGGPINEEAAISLAKTMVK